MFEWAGWAAAALTTLAFVPQVLLTLRTRDVSGISLPMYVMYCSGVALWLVYGIYRASVPLIAANSVGLVLAGCVLVVTIRGKAVKRKRARR